MTDVPYVSAAELEHLLDYPSLVDALAEGFAADWTVPVRHHYSIPMPNGEPDQTLLLMPAWEAGQAIGMKLATITPGNGPRGLPAVNAVYLLVDGPTGQPRALIEGASLTVRRTAAASALAARYLARTDASRMLMVGAGALSRPLIEAHCSQHSIKRVQLWARDAKKRDAKVRELAALGLPVEPADDLEQCAREADLISCATLSKEPLIRGAWLKSGGHLDLVGAFTPEMRESDDAAIGRASLFCDTRAGALKEGGDLVIPLKAGLITEAAIKADLADLTRGKHKGRMSADEVTLFKSVGTAIEDFAAARLAMQRLQAR
ncbi:bifunctional Delta(1)-pyrroline-2-carboxylate/Delta(1)-piperideine-2-carboxylate reductase [Dongia deserti]|uniref:ornithine cyclodeaminase family protein n=1 Tax=Dongia deserti TaxID=2268030 RepID=UPI000E65AA88|nr:ornithine cyclodeaminase family protein [Dongia deserti]